MADVAADVHLCGRFREGEIGRTHANLRLRAEHFPREEQDGLLQVCKSDVLVNIKAFHLVEDAMGAGRYGLVAENAPGAYHADGQGLGFHGAHLYGRGVRAQQQRIQVAGADEKSVLHFTRGVVGREVQGLEDVVVVFDFGAFGHVVAEFAENIHNLLPYDRDRMAGAQRKGVSGHGQVLRRAVRSGNLPRRSLQLLNTGRCGFLELIELLAIFALEFRRHGAELLHERGHFPFLSKETDAGFLHLFGGGGFKAGQFGKNLFYGLFHFFFLLSRASWARFPPVFQYFFHCWSVNSRLYVLSICCIHLSWTLI